MTDKMNRRQWLQTTVAGAAGLGVLGRATQSIAATQKRLRVAAVVTEFTFRSHAHVILENFFEPYYFNGELVDPGMDVVSLFADQFPKTGDLSGDFARKYGFKIYPTIAETLRCGGDDLAVDAVLAIGEHGEYPKNDRKQHMYPRKRFFDEITAVFRQCGRSVPLFNDKHFTYRWDWAAEMMQVVRELKIPFMAGSSVPLAERQPPFELPDQAVIEEAVSIHGGGLESYDFHSLEVLQSVVEARRGGETGVREVQLLEGDDVWKAAEAGRFSLPLAEAAMRASEQRDVGDLRTFTEPSTSKTHPVHAILIQYKDGLRATMLRMGSSATRWSFACRLANSPEPMATRFYVGPWNNRNLFKALSHAIQTHIRQSKSPYPIERTFLTTGILAAAMDSRFEQHRLLPTPQLDIAYQPLDYRNMREMGASWKLITESTPEPQGLESGNPRGK